MKLYYAPGACSLAPHIALCEGQLSFEIEKVDLKNKITETGQNFLKINEKGYVPALQLEDGDVLTEATVILQYIADLAPEAKLIAPAGTRERYHVQEWLTYISSEVHKLLSALFRPDVPEEYKKIVREAFGKRCDFLSEKLANQPFLMGDHFTVPDAYCFTVLRWTKHFKIDLSPWPELLSYFKRIGLRELVLEALRAENLND